jgi:hypothetical protein
MTHCGLFRDVILANPGEEQAFSKRMRAIIEAHSPRKQQKKSGPVVLSSDEEDIDGELNQASDEDSEERSQASDEDNNKETYSLLMSDLAGMSLCIECDGQDGVCV